MIGRKIGHWIGQDRVEIIEKANEYKILCMWEYRPKS